MTLLLDAHRRYALWERAIDAIERDEVGELHPAPGLEPSRPSLDPAVTNHRTNDEDVDALVAAMNGARDA